MTVAGLVLGLGLEPGTPIGHVHAVLEGIGVARDDVTVVATIDTRADEPAVHELAAGRELRLYPAAVLDAVEVPTPSAVVRRLTGTGSVAEAAALLAAGAHGELVVPKVRGTGVTVALAR